MKWPEELNFMKNSRLPQKETSASMKGLLSVVSGSTSGVGLATLKLLASAGSDLVIVCRNKEKALPIQEELIQTYHVHVDIVVADFSSFEDVRKAAEYILQTYPKIDVLINSVGIHSTKKLFNEDGIELCFVVNHLSTFLFTKLLIPRLKESAPSRIIQINSEGHRFSNVKLNDVNFKHRIYTGLKGYGQSKTAQLMTVWELNDQLKGSGVTINACHPGAVKTAIGSNNGPLYRWYFKHVTSHFLKDPIISAKAIYYLAADPELKDVSGRFYNLTIDEVPAKHARDRILGKQVYDQSMKLVGLNHD
jgi:NAD(P)-dependent dehydrogenase (short-subunit alcohol dehydrogenase family)